MLRVDASGCDCNSRASILNVLTFYHIIKNAPLVGRLSEIAAGSSRGSGRPAAASYLDVMMLAAAPVAVAASILAA